MDLRRFVFVTNIRFVLVTNTRFLTVKCQAAKRSRTVAHLTHKPEVPRPIPGPATTFVSPSDDSRRAVVSYWRKYVHEVLIKH